MYHSSFEILEAQLKKTISSGLLPAVCVFHNFGFKGSNSRKEIQRDIGFLKHFFINEKGYKLISKTGGFEIFENPELRRLSRLP